MHTESNLGARRFQPEVMRTILQANGHDTPASQWLLDRFVSVAYYALINYKEVIPKPDALSDSCEWYPINNLPELNRDDPGDHQPDRRDAVHQSHRATLPRLARGICRTCSAQVSGGLHS